MRTAALTYTFGTQKTELGLHHLALHGFTPSVILAAPPVELNFYHSKVRVAPKGLPSTTPKDLARYYGAEYREIPHNSPTAAAILLENDIEIAVILGARIIKQPLIDATEYGILNMHPGLLPDNRGLDNLKWAVLLGMPMAVTAHLIDSRIDMGRLIKIHDVPIYRDDTLMDVFLRSQAVERDAMVDAMVTMENELLAGRWDFPSLSAGTYRHAVPPEIESGLLPAFEAYKERFSVS